MINRELRDWPDDSGHVPDLEAAGAVVIRGQARVDGPGRFVVSSADDEGTLGARAILIAVGTNSTIPDDIEGLGQIRPWTNREATTARELPQSLVVLGAGPPASRWPRSMPAMASRRSSSHRTSGSAPRTIRATRPPSTRLSATTASTSGPAFARRASGRDRSATMLTSSSCPTRRAVKGHEILIAAGRTASLANLGLETVGVHPEDS